MKIKTLLNLLSNLLNHELCFENYLDLCKIHATEKIKKANLQLPVIQGLISLPKNELKVTKKSLAVILPF